MFSKGLDFVPTWNMFQEEKEIKKFFQNMCVYIGTLTFPLLPSNSRHECVFDRNGSVRNAFQSMVLSHDTHTRLKDFAFRDEPFITKKGSEWTSQ